MWVRKSDLIEIYTQLGYLQGEVAKLKREHCEHLNCEFYHEKRWDDYFRLEEYYIKACSNCGKTLNKYDTFEEHEKSMLLYNKQTAERKLKEANEAIVKNEKKNK